MAETVSLRVNALFASIVALEATQCAATTSDTDADAMGTRALATYDEVFAIRDTNANADLIAARIMLNLMMAHCWPALESVEWTTDDRFELATLELLAEATTGAVRQEARRVLATVGVEVLPEADAESIESMTRRLRVIHDRPLAEAEDDSDTPSPFEVLRDRILATPPRLAS